MSASMKDEPSRKNAFARIPSPKGIPIFGNLFQVPRSALTQYFTKVAKDFSGIFRISFAGYPVTFVTDPELVGELADSKRFRKLVGPPLSFLRALAGDGLFTSHSEEPNWQKAHRVLVPAFGQRAMRGYYELMLPVADELIAKWQAAPNGDVMVTEDMTRYTLETIGVSGFGYRFNLFDPTIDQTNSTSMHPFTDAMYAVLTEAMERLTRLRIPTPVWVIQNIKYKRNIAYMHRLVDEVVAQRRANPVESRDILGLMLNAVDEQSGQSLSDENIRFQVITFLIAGHETTSGLLSFALYYLVKNPQVLQQTVAEIDQVLPNGKRPSYDDLSELLVLERVIKETLRLWPTAPVYSVAPFADTVIGGRYKIKRNHRINILLTGLHRDNNSWEQPEVFDINRFAPGNEERIRAQAYKPFGNGERACIGRQFAYAEAKLALAMILQSFEISDPYDYSLVVKETLSLKPDQFKLRLRARDTKKPSIE
jgi:cytochrome P450 / NADPH-cytochrome P450 reductase